MCKVFFVGIACVDGGFVMLRWLWGLDRIWGFPALEVVAMRTPPISKCERSGAPGFVQVRSEFFITLRSLM